MKTIFGCLKYIVYIFEIYFLYSVMHFPGPAFKCFGISPLVVICAFVCIATFENEFVGMLYGILSGFLIDLSYGNVFGMYALVFGLVGYIMGVVFNYFVKSNFLSTAVISGFISFLFANINYYFFYVKNNFANLDVWQWANICLGYVICAIIYTLPIFFFNRSVFYFTQKARGGNN